MAPAVTDADVALGRIDAEAFAGGRLTLDAKLAETALTRDVGAALSLTPDMAALGISEVVDENMANAARVHAIEIGASLSERTMIAFGGAAPLHAARLAEKLEIDRVLIPTNAAVGSAVGFLRAPVAYQVVKSAYQKISRFDAEAANEIAIAYGLAPYAFGRQGYARFTRDRLRDIIMGMTRPDSWQESGGGQGYIAKVPGSLVVAHRSDTHRTIRRLLEWLEERPTRPMATTPVSLRRARGSARTPAS